MKKTKYITLTLTEKCNLNCIYCYENNKSKEIMSLEVAKDIISYELNLNDADVCEIDLFGGEPFLVYNNIKKIVDFIENNEWKMQTIIFIVTNGTLVDAEVQEWLKRHPKVICGLSLDGTPYMHNLNRSNSFEKIPIDFFARQYPKQNIKMTISTETLSDLAEGVIYCHSKGFEVSCNLAFGIDWSNNKNCSILERELLKLISFYLKNPSIKPCTMLDFDITKAGLPLGEYIKKWCGAGTTSKTYSVQGVAYPCQFFMPLSAGTLAESFLKNDCLDEYISIDKFEEKCRSCSALAICPMCYGANLVNQGSVYKQNDNLCRLNKIMFKARALFKARQWEKGQLELSPEKELLLLRSIIKLQEL